MEGAIDGHEFERCAGRRGRKTLTMAVVRQGGDPTKLEDEGRGRQGRSRPLKRRQPPLGRLASLLTVRLVHVEEVAAKRGEVLRLSLTSGDARLCERRAHHHD